MVRGFFRILWPAFASLRGSCFAARAALLGQYS